MMLLLQYRERWLLLLCCAVFAAAAASSACAAAPPRCFSWSSFASALPAIALLQLLLQISAATVVAGSIVDAAWRLGTGSLYLSCCCFPGAADAAASAYLVLLPVFFIFAQVTLLLSQLRCPGDKRPADDAPAAAALHVKGAAVHLLARCLG